MICSKNSARSARRSQHSQTQSVTKRSRVKTVLLAALPLTLALLPLGASTAHGKSNPSKPSLKKTQDLPSPITVVITSPAELAVLKPSTIDATKSPLALGLAYVQREDEIATAATSPITIEPIAITASQENALAETLDTTSATISNETLDSGKGDEASKLADAPEQAIKMQAAEDSTGAAQSLVPNGVDVAQTLSPSDYSFPLKEKYLIADPPSEHDAHQPLKLPAAVGIPDVDLKKDPVYQELLKAIQSTSKPTNQSILGESDRELADDELFEAAEELLSVARSLQSYEKKLRKKGHVDAAENVRTSIEKIRKQAIKLLTSEFRLSEKK